MRIGKIRAEKLYNGESLNGHSFKEENSWPNRVRYFKCRACNLEIQVVKTSPRLLGSNCGRYYTVYAVPDHNQATPLKNLPSCNEYRMDNALK